MVIFPFLEIIHLEKKTRMKRKKMSMRKRNMMKRKR
jgi:hypothetical protein